MQWYWRPTRVVTALFNSRVALNFKSIQSIQSSVYTLQVLQLPYQWSTRANLNVPAPKVHLNLPPIIHQFFHSGLFSSFTTCVGKASLSSTAVPSSPSSVPSHLLRQRSLNYTLYYIITSVCEYRANVIFVVICSTIAVPNCTAKFQKKIKKKRTLRGRMIHRIICEIRSTFETLNHVLLPKKRGTLHIVAAHFAHIDVLKHVASSSASPLRHYLILSKPPSSSTSETSFFCYHPVTVVVYLLLYSVFYSPHSTPDLRARLFLLVIIAHVIYVLLTFLLNLYSIVDGVLSFFFLFYSLPRPPLPVYRTHVSSLMHADVLHTPLFVNRMRYDVCRIVDSIPDFFCNSTAIWHQFIAFVFTRNNIHF